MRIYLLLCVFVIITSPTNASGYQLGLHGQKQMGMGLIGTPFSMDASSAFYNPSGLSFMPVYFNVAAGTGATFSSTAFQKRQPSLYQTTTESKTNYPFYFYAAGKINDRLAAGIAINNPFGNNVQWDDNWPGKYIVLNSSLNVLSFQPTLSYRIFESFSLGAGFVLAVGDLNFSRALPFQGLSAEGSIKIQGNTTGIGFNAGIMFNNLNGFSAGLSYRSQILMDIDDAKALFKVPPSLFTLFPFERNLATSIPLPANLGFGLSYKLSRKIILALALDYVFWSTYQTLDFDFYENSPSVADISYPRYFSDKLIIRIGGELLVNKHLAFRAGSYFDPSPVSNNYFLPDTPGLDNMGFTAGISYAPSVNFCIDMSLVYIMGLEKELNYSPSDFGGTFESRTLIPGIGLSYNI